MEMAEKMDTGHNQTKKRRQSSENVSTENSYFISIMCILAESVESEWTRPFLLFL